MRQVDKRKVWALLPVFNEEQTLGDVIDRVGRQGVNILVVDDGSTDGSVFAARQKGVRVLVHEKNRGKGAAIRTGFGELMKTDCEWALLLDSDGQHLPEEIPLFLKAAATGKYAVLNGSRMRDPRGMPWIRRFANRWMSLWVSRRAGLEVEDAQCGYKMLSMDFVRRARLTAERYEIEDDLILEASRLGLRIGSVAVTSRYGFEKSRIHPFRDTWRFLVFMCGKKS